METETVFAAAVFAAVFLFGSRIQPLRPLGHRVITSFGAGMASAYVFVRLMPELNGAREAFAGAASELVRFEGMGIYFVALVGFLVFYGLEHLRRKLRQSGADRGAEDAGEAATYRLHLASFGVYVFVMGYLLVHGLEESATSVTVYAVAIAFHFLSIDHELREEYGDAYNRGGCYVLAGAALAGWGLGLLFEISLAGLALLVAFVSGAVIMNSAIMELPHEKEGRFIPFLLGGMLYGLVLVPLG